MNARTQPGDLAPPAAQDWPALEGNHRPFSNLGGELHGNEDAAFLDLAIDIGHGIETCLELVHSSDAERAYNMQADADPDMKVMPMLSWDDTERLLRLAVVSARTLAQEAERRRDRMSRRVLALPD